jgi:hypothetical protein
MAPVSVDSRRKSSGTLDATRSGAWRKVIDGGPRYAFGYPKNDGEWGIGRHIRGSEPAWAMSHRDPAGWGHFWMTDRQSSSQNDPTTAENKNNANRIISRNHLVGQGNRDRIRIESIPWEAKGTLVHDDEAMTFKIA